MIISLSVIVISFYWLLRETHWLTIQLVIGYVDCPFYYDYDSKYDGSDRIYNDDYQEQLDKAIEDYTYEKWLEKQSEPIYIHSSLAPRAWAKNIKEVDPRDKWMAVEEDLTKRRSGEMIYQRG